MALVAWQQALVDEYTDDRARMMLESRAWAQEEFGRILPTWGVPYAAADVDLRPSNSACDMPTRVAEWTYTLDGVRFSLEHLEGTEYVVMCRVGTNVPAYCSTRADLARYLTIVLGNTGDDDGTE